MRSVLLKKQVTLQDQANKLAQYLPNSREYEAKNIKDSNLRKILIGLSSEFLRLRSKVNYIYEQYDPRTTTDFIEEWESDVGIPDDCFSRNVSLEQRRQQVLLKIAGLNATTSEQFENIGNILGFNIVVTNAVDDATFPLTFPLLLASEEEKRFIIVVKLLDQQAGERFPLTFPLTFNSQFPAILRCLFEKIKPAHCKIFFRYQT